MVAGGIVYWPCVSLMSGCMTNWRVLVSHGYSLVGPWTLNRDVNRLTQLTNKRNMRRVAPGHLVWYAILNSHYDLPGVQPSLEALIGEKHLRAGG